VAHTARGLLIAIYLRKSASSFTISSFERNHIIEAWFQETSQDVLPAEICWESPCLFFSCSRDSTRCGSTRRVNVLVVLRDAARKRDA